MANAINPAPAGLPDSVPGRHMTATWPDPMLPTPFVVQKVKRETSDTYTLDLTRADGATNFAFAPGQFNLLYAFGAGEDVLIIAGGLGLAPLRPALYHLLHHRGEFGNIEVIYGARTPKDLLYPKELERWRGRFDLRVHVTVDSATDDWRSNVGVVTKIIDRARFDPPSTVALVDRKSTRLN